MTTHFAHNTVSIEILWRNSDNECTSTIPLNQSAGHPEHRPGGKLPQVIPYKAQAAGAFCDSLEEGLVVQHVANTLTLKFPSLRWFLRPKSSMLGFHFSSHRVHTEDNSSQKESEQIANNRVNTALATPQLCGSTMRIQSHSHMHGHNTVHSCVASCGVTHRHVQCCNCGPSEQTCQASSMLQLCAK